MNTARADALAARSHLLDEGGWQFRRGDAFRVMPPPPVAVWLGDDGAACDAPPLAGAGWTLHPVGAPGLVDARWLDAADPAQRAELLAGLPTPGDDAAAPFAWAHRALCRRGLRLRIAAPADDGAPPLLLQLRHLPCDAVEAPLLVVELEPGARCVVIETHVRDEVAARPPGTHVRDDFAACPPETHVRDGAPACRRDVVQNLQLHLQLGTGARLQHWRLVQPGAGDRVAHHVHARLGGGAFYGQALLATGAAYHLQRTIVALDGTGADARAGSVLLADGDRGSQVDRQVRVVHAAARSASEVDVLALARHRALAAGDLHAHVRPGAEGADVRQHLAGIPTAGAPRLVLRPQLEIEHDAVQAAHGATWGRLPEDALFLARQRGLDEANALALILQGMATAVLARGLGEDALPDAVGATPALAAALAGHLQRATGDGRG
ncbi:SufD family Fe-S cluster assembly protein [Azohydromonas sp.]|uniref:SufD family Fe-S cluster assembly protein n=1 Tax=Azohydromonas sp. TaxID=1872666 RepID=UPI002CDFEF06|nr:SufD family Fe-S cluster assembly protein [Azohydromonas sp.]HMM86823.1 SufD family Fe-S cluster assembly protein [Azohydromonas sp.]